MTPSRQVRRLAERLAKKVSARAEKLARVWGDTPPRRKTRAPRYVGHPVKPARAARVPVTRGDRLRLAWAAQERARKAEKRARMMGER